MMNPEIGVCSWSLRPQGPAHLAEMLQRLGIPAVQLALVPLVEKPRVWADAGEMLTAAGIHIASGMLAMVGEDYLTLNTIRRTGGVRPDADWPVNRQRCADVARVAEQAGLGLVTFHAGFLPEQRDDPLRRTMIERLRTDGITVLLVEQSTVRALAVADWVCVLESGRGVFQGTGAEARDDPALFDTYLGLADSVE